METLDTVATLEARGSEVRELVQEGEIDLAVRRLLDLAKDFAPTRELRNETLSVSAKHNSLRVEARRYGVNADITRDRDVLIIRTLDLIDLIEEEAYRRPIVLGTSPNDAIERSKSAASAPSIADHSIDTTSPSSLEQAKEQFWRREREHNKAREFQVPVCRCENLSKTYRKGSMPFALRDVSLTLTLGRVTGVVGANGHGKTTLLRVIAGDLRHTAGSLEYPLILADKAANWLRIKSQIAYVPQNNPSWGKATLETSLRFTAAAFGRTMAGNDDEVEFILHRLGLEKYRSARWDELSAGYRIRGAIANALMSFPKLLVLDEPLANLDIDTQMQFLEDLRDLAKARESGFAALVTSQHLHEIETIADDILFLEDGAPTFYGSKRDIGGTRKANTFELQSDFGRDRLTQLFDDSGQVEVSQIGTSLILWVPLTMTGGEILSRLVTAGASIYYFRDISHSTRTMMMRLER
jgi:ABC-2 type transport system ATP-binding protein